MKDKQISFKSKLVLVSFLSESVIFWETKQLQDLSYCMGHYYPQLSSKNCFATPLNLVLNTPKFLT